MEPRQNIDQAVCKKTLAGASALAEAAFSTEALEAPEATVEHIFVKWENPTEELVSMAKLAQAMADRAIADANQICVLAPNTTWALQAKRAFDALEVPADLRISNRPLSAEARASFALLKLIAEPENHALKDAYLKAGNTPEAFEALIAAYGKAQTPSLVRMTGLDACPEFEAALRHTCGDETAPELCALLTQQMKCPTAPAGVHIISILPYTAVRDTYEQVFFVGCVDGLVPSLSLYEKPVEEQDALMKQARAAFHKAVGSAAKRVFISSFSKLPAEVAAKAHVKALRKKTEGGIQMAMAQPTPFMTELGAHRPSTLGGQALLRMYALN